MIVRFRLDDHDNWAYGQAIGTSSDGSINIGPFSADQVRETGRKRTVSGIRSIMPEHVEVRSIGPRGGELWEAFDGATHEVG